MINNHLYIYIYTLSPVVASFNINHSQWQNMWDSMFLPQDFDMTDRKTPTNTDKGYSNPIGVGHQKIRNIYLELLIQNRRQYILSPVQTTGFTGFLTCPMRCPLADDTPCTEWGSSQIWESFAIPSPTLVYSSCISPYSWDTSNKCRNKPRTSLNVPGDTEWRTCHNLQLAWNLNLYSNSHQRVSFLLDSAQLVQPLNH